MTKKKSHHKSEGFTIPLAPIAGIMAMPTIHAIIDDVTTGAWSNIPQHIGGIVGMDNAGVFHYDWLVQNMIPLIAGALIHKFIGGKLGINRMLARAGVPIIRL